MLQDTRDILYCYIDEFDLQVILDIDYLSFCREIDPEIDLPALPHRANRDLPKMHVELLPDLKIACNKLRILLHNKIKARANPKAPARAYNLKILQDPRRRRILDNPLRKALRQLNF